MFEWKIKHVYQITFPEWGTGIDSPSKDLPWAAVVRFSHYAGWWRHATVTWNGDAEAHWLYLATDNLSETLPEWQQWVEDNGGVMVKLRDYPHWKRGKLSPDEKHYISTGERR